MALLCHRPCWWFDVQPAVMLFLCSYPRENHSDTTVYLSQGRQRSQRLSQQSELLSYARHLLYYIYQSYHIVIAQNPRERLGCHPQTGFADIMEHPFFRPVDWELVWWMNEVDAVWETLFFSSPNSWNRDKSLLHTDHVEMINGMWQTLTHSLLVRLWNSHKTTGQSLDSLPGCKIWVWIWSVVDCRKVIEAIDQSEFEGFEYVNPLLMSMADEV